MLTLAQVDCIRRRAELAKYTHGTARSAATDTDTQCTSDAKTSVMGYYSQEVFRELLERREDEYGSSVIASCILSLTGLQYGESISWEGLEDVSA